MMVNSAASSSARSIGRRRLLLGAGALPLLTACRGTSSPPTAHLGWLSPWDRGQLATPTVLRYFSRLRELGYVTRRNLRIDYAFADLRVEALPHLASGLVEQEVDVIVAVASIAATAARRATETVPIVFYTDADPVKDGLVRGYAHPATNCTGVAVAESANRSWEKELDLLKQAFPHIARLAVLYASADSTPAVDLEAVWPRLDATARALAITIQRVDLSGEGGVPAAFTRILDGRADALVWAGTESVHRDFESIRAFVAAQRLPTISLSREWVRRGDGLLYYGPSEIESMTRLAEVTNKVLRGAKPALLPVEQPTTYEFLVNLRTAHALGLTIDPAVLAQATEVIQ